ncbi:MAG: hypothetical protein AB7T06_17065 [Kofleriaceae bacterium]
MSRATLALIVLAGCFRVGPVKVGLLPPMPNGTQRDPDRTRNFIAEPATPSGEGGVAAAGADPLGAGPVSGGVTLTSIALWRLAGLPAFLGVYGTFDETGLVELDPDKREEQAKRAKPTE